MAIPTIMYVIPNAAAVMKIPASARKAISDNSGNGTYITVQVTGFMNEKEIEFISFEAKFKVLSDNF